VNSLAELRALPAGQGVELDLRETADDVVVTHDPFTIGPRLSEWLEASGPRPLILNVKAEGLERKVLELTQAHGFTDVFLLDLTVPAAMRLARAGERRFAVRWSEVEPLEAVLAFEGRADWVWVDCFTRWPGADADWARLARSFRLCVVSPELQGHEDATIAAFRAQLAGRPFHAACTKRPELWAGADR
jgi:hypothetical protein